MFLLTRPDGARIERFLAERATDTFSYPNVGATREPSPPAGYFVDHNRQFLGNGRLTFDSAKEAIRLWTMLKVPDLELNPPVTTIEPGRNVALLARHLGLYSLNSCRIVYVVEEENRYGFAYGTLTEHVESGEERFTVEFHTETGEVWYDLYAFSRPGHWLVKLGLPYARHLQKRFAAHSKAQLAHYVRDQKPPR